MKRRKLFTGNKGIVDDLFDMMFVIIVLFFGMFIIYFALATNAEARETASNAVVDGPNFYQTLILMLESNFEVNDITYSGAELALMVLATDQSELFTEKLEKYIEESRISGGFVLYKGESVDDSTSFAIARGEDVQYYVTEPATVLLENPEDGSKYLIAFYGEEE